MIVRRERNYFRDSQVGSLANLLFVIAPFYIWLGFCTASVSVKVMALLMLGFAFACGIAYALFSRDWPPYGLWLVPFSIYLETNLLLGKWFNTRLLLYCTVAGIAALAGWVFILGLSKLKRT